MNMGKFQRTTATDKIFGLRQRIRAVAGGTAASKTVSILFWLIDYAQSTRGDLISIVSESYPHLEKGAMRDFKAIMQDTGYWNDARWNDSKHIYTFESGSTIEFFSVDTYGKAHGPRRDVLFVNECNNMAYAIVDQLITRTRKIVWLDWNPSTEFWFYTEMLPHRQDIDFITLTYKDNEALDATSVAEIESHKYNKAWWQVYGLGQLGEIEGRIFKGWKLIDEIPHEARLEVRGLDFGFARDPAALCDIYYYNGGYIVDELLHRIGMFNRQISDVILNQPDPNALTIGDSADPKDIAEMQQHGVNIIGVEKKGLGDGNSFANSSIRFVQSQQMSITARSLNFIKSYRNFMWQYDRDGNILSPPKYDHYLSDGMMAVVYGMTNFWRGDNDDEEEVYSTGNFASAWAR